MKIAILGYGQQGRSVYDYYKSIENEITVCDMSSSVVVPSDATLVSGANYLKNLNRFDLIFRSPLVHPSELLKYNDKEILNKVTSNTNEFIKLCPTKNIIGVTGTKGKGTTSTLITKILEDMGHKVHLGGNIGIPPLDLLKAGIKEDDWVVLELANFQLIDLKYSPHIAICLIVEPEHLDWHKDLKEYYGSKAELFKHQSKKDIAIFYSDRATSREIAANSPGRLIPYFKTPGALVSGNHIVIDGKPIIRTSELKLLGEHNWQNICAAVTAVWQIDRNIESISHTLSRFSGLPFRIELRKEVKGISYYNDSFSSAPTAAIAAIDTIKEPKVLILGGKDRGIDLCDLIDKIEENSKTIRKIILIGEAKGRIEENLKEKGFSNYIVSDAKSMKEIVALATDNAKSGDSVVLSPGFPSFDMFKNFEDRGIKFNQEVEKL